jgi:protocatechuate 3,4-dioxygenase beta subunit
MNRRGAVAIAGVGLVALAAWLLWGGDREGAVSSEAAPDEVGAGSTAKPGWRPGLPDRRPARRGAIEGTIRDPAGGPIGGAHVCGNASSDELATDDILEPICATTGADGRYRLASLFPASYRIDASAPRFRPAQHRDVAHGRDELLLGPGEVRGDIDLVLQPGGIEVVGVVNDLGGGPIAGAWVQASSRRAGAASLTRTAADGSFRLWFVPGPLRLVALADGYVEGDLTAFAPGQTIEILLTPESTLTGRVVEVGSGAPVAGARVGFDGRNTAISDEDGRFRLTHLLPGRYKPYATSPTGVGKADESVLVGLGQTVEGVTIALHPGVQVTGKVVGERDDTLCAEGTLTLDHTATNRSRQAPIVDGLGRMDGVLPGTYQVSVDCSGYLRYAGQPDLVVDLAAPPGEQRWTVQPAARIRGVVRGADGMPVAGASVTATHTTLNLSSERMGNARSQADGSFEIDQLVGGPYSVVAQAPDHPPAGSVAATAVEGAAEAPIEIRLPGGGDLAGEVVDDRGRPVPRVTVGTRARGAPEWVGSELVQTRDDGTFTFLGLAPGIHDVHVVREDTAPAGAPSSAGEARPDGTATIAAGATARMRIAVPAHDGVIRGRVVDGKGDPIIDAFVDAYVDKRDRGLLRGHWQRRPALTDTSGSFALERLGPGAYTVRAYRRGGGEAVLEGAAVGTTLTLAIQSTGSVTGTVKTSTGAVPERVTVSARDLDTGFERGENFFRTGGRFAIKDLPPGHFEVVASAEGSAATIKTRVEAGQSVTGIDLVLGAPRPQD